METFKTGKSEAYESPKTESPGGRERRLHTRHRLMSRMTVATSENAFSGLATNLSSRGLCVVSRHRVSPKTSVQLHLPLPQANDNQPIKTQATACWSRPILMGSETYHMTGFCFTDIRPETENLLDTFCLTLPLSNE